MTLRPSWLFILPIIAFSTATFAAPTTGGCAAKQQDIQQQIDYAKKHGSSHRVAGLETALREVVNNCTDAGLEADRQKRIAEKQQEVAKRKQELAEAKETGKSDKIANKQEKLDEAEQELKEASAQ
ncbi:DUF1090 domain-containing protein [Edaphovirga cremea]|uniref:DUF1090 domain-containing protein n=1 Tax=Edaphovirga cremea TaxID=2267246 RepID=UPI000DEF5290|nr:DUF1090 domain-containing protein [Edaphovirga cremea]